MQPFPEVQKWMETIQQRPAVERGVNIPEMDYDLYFKSATTP